jgi:4,5-dihydroxyphthalate decarboxylase
MNKPLHLGCLDYFDRTRALVDGRVTVRGFDLRCNLVEKPGDLFRRVLCGEFDVAEMSFATYAVMRSTGDDRFIALPAFVSRNFRHSYIFVNARAGIEKPEDLTGRKVGIPEYQLTGTVWIRGMLQHKYGVHQRNMSWYTNWNSDVDGRGRAERVNLQLPEDLSLTEIPQHASLGEMLEHGELDAIIASTVPKCISSGSSAVRRLFPDYAREERAYYRDTRIFPIMHLIVVRSDLLQRAPGLAQDLYAAYCEARRLDRVRLAVTGHLACAIPWLHECLAELQTFGDMWTYGLSRNSAVVDVALQYMHEQGLSRERLRAGEIFLAVDDSDLY